MKLLSITLILVASFYFIASVNAKEELSGFGHVTPLPNDNNSYARSRYKNYGLNISDSDSAHWNQHLANVGQDEWEKAFHRDVVQRLFGQCHDPIGGDLQHWINHSRHVSPQQFVHDVHEDWRCKRQQPQQQQPQQQQPQQPQQQQQQPQQSNAFQSGSWMQPCGCWSPSNPTPYANDMRCQSNRVRLVVCSGTCSNGVSPYGYVCQ